MISKTQQDFSEYIGKLWNDEISFRHSYSIVNGNYRWKTWQNRHAEKITIWRCDSFREALTHYSWHSYGPTFRELSASLRRHCQNNDYKGASAVCEEIFKWGGVGRRRNDPSRTWIVKCTKDKSLVKNMKLATQLLKGETKIGNSFDKNGLLMNSTMTKIYSALDSNVIMYDGRVGAAFGLLVKNYLRSIKAHKVPSDLAFLWGPPQRNLPSNARNPSSDSFKFDSLYNRRVTDSDRAELVRAAGKILQSASNDTNLRDFEKALFMIGYRVDHPHNS